MRRRSRGRTDAELTRLDPSRPDVAILMEWQAAFSRADLITNYGAEHLLPDLLDDLAMPGCPKIKNQWDRCGVYYVNPIAGRER